MESSSQVRLWDLYEKARPLGLAWSFVYAAVLVLTGGVSSFLPGFAGVKPSGPQPLSWFPGQRPHLGVLCHLSFSLFLCVTTHHLLVFSISLSYASLLLIQCVFLSCSVDVIHVYICLFLILFLYIATLLLFNHTFACQHRLYYIIF